MNNLIDKYLSGTSTREEEQTLRRMLSAVASLTPGQRAVQAMLQAEPMQALPQWLTEDASATYDRIVERRHHASLWRWTGIAVAACLVLGFLLIVPRGGEAENCAVATIYGQETTDEALVLGMMENTMQSVLACSTTDHIEGQLTDILNP